VGHAGHHVPERGHLLRLRKSLFVCVAFLGLFLNHRLRPPNDAVQHGVQQHQQTRQRRELHLLRVLRMATLVQRLLLQVCLLVGGCLADALQGLLHPVQRGGDVGLNLEHRQRPVRPGIDQRDMAGDHIAGV